MSWAIAQDISNRTVNILNAYLKQMDKDDNRDGLQLLFGMCLTLKAMEESMPLPEESERPFSLKILLESAHQIMYELDGIKDFENAGGKVKRWDQ